MHLLMREDVEPQDNVRACMDELPPEIWGKILGYLDYGGVVAVGGLLPYVARYYWRLRERVDLNKYILARMNCSGHARLRNTFHWHQSR